MAAISNEIRWAQYQIFNRLCVEYLRDKSDFFIRASDIRKDLNLGRKIFGEAILAFKSGDSSVVEVIESGGETYLRLGGSARDNCE